VQQHPGNRRDRRAFLARAGVLAMAPLAASVAARGTVDAAAPSGGFDFDMPLNRVGTDSVKWDMPMRQYDMTLIVAGLGVYEKARAGDAGRYIERLVRKECRRVPGIGRWLRSRRREPPAHECRHQSRHPHRGAGQSGENAENALLRSPEPRRHGVTGSPLSRAQLSSWASPMRISSGPRM